MKFLPLLILSIISINSHSQKTSYKHTYQITPYLESHHNSVKIDTLDFNSKYNLQMTFTDHDDQPLKKIEIVLNNVDTSFTMTTDSLGMIDLNTNFKIFKIDIQEEKYQKVQSLILLQNHHLVSYKIKLCELSDLDDLYFIKSKDQLSEEEISDIRDCIEKSSKIEDFDMEGDYIISIENKEFSLLKPQ